MMVKTTHTPFNLCPHCGHTINAASDFERNKKPKPGDAAICIACAGVCLFTEDLRLRVLTAAELRQIAQNPHVTRIRLAIRMGQKKFGADWVKEKSGRLT